MDQVPTVLGLGGAIACLFTALWRGWLWTGPAVDRMVTELRQRAEVAERREAGWRDAHDRQAEVSRIAVAQVSELVTAMRVIEAHIRSTPDAIRSVLPPEQTEGNVRE